MEAALGVDLPDDARAIIRFYRGGMLGGISHLTWATTGSYSVVERTAALRRALDLPAIFVVLAEPVEAAIVWRRDRPSVVWCHAHDIERVVRGEPPTSDVTSWDTYAGFFEYMLNAEEEEQSE